MLVDFTSLLAASTGPGGHLRPFLVGLLFLPVLVGRRTRPWLRRLVGLAGQDSVTGQPGVRTFLAVITLFLALAESLGTITVLEAFLAGVLVASLLGEDRETLQGKLDAIGFGYFIPFFFVNLGAQLQLGGLLHSPAAWILTAALLGAAFLLPAPPAARPLPAPGAPPLPPPSWPPPASRSRWQGPRCWPGRA
ncbi:membrane protein of unknown function [Candidatus Hydrogenisulfobacillus filiaventi]|uniref:Cation/H+ exchanger transmembrane domain-containing protein n=1 Tax=Candidatus Hydrogenisulfobacillus filiaventi TaxID=2707344 RepID=A0A6F8ZKP5_9FIRM|nr:membrane protein of unknown function [Candidatus Hydrogenisulfobacillus filiaventi]